MKVRDERTFLILIIGVIPKRGVPSGQDATLKKCRLETKCIGQKFCECRDPACKGTLDPSYLFQKLSVILIRMPQRFTSLCLTTIQRIWRMRWWLVGNNDLRVLKLNDKD